MARTKTHAQWLADKVRELEYSHGIRHLVDPSPAARRIRIWRSRGVGLAVIGERTDVSTATIRKIQGGQLNTIRTLTMNKIMNAQFTSEDLVRFPAFGVRRRLRALVAGGFTTVTLGEMIERDNRQVNLMTLGKESRDWVTPKVGIPVYTAYEKYRTVDPRDLGQSGFATNYAARVGVKRGWAPEHCWDQDTIDDPEAFPEWTGRCGTVRGWRIHLDEGIHIYEVSKRNRTVRCEPCLTARLAHIEENGGRGSVVAFDRELMHELFQEGMTTLEVSIELGVHMRTILRARKEVMNDPQDSGG